MNLNVWCYMVNHSPYLSEMSYAQRQNKAIDHNG